MQVEDLLRVEPGSLLLADTKDAQTHLPLVNPRWDLSRRVGKRGSL